MEAPPATPPPPRPAPWSVGRRLTVWYTLSAFGMLFVATAFLYLMLAGELRKEDEQALFDEVQTLRAILREHPDEMGPLQVEVELETPVRPSAKYFARILDESGRVVIENSRMQRALLNATAFPEPREIIQSLGRPTTWRSPGGRTFLLTAARAQWGSPSRGRRTIQLALEVTREETMLARYRGWLGLVLFVGVGASAAAGVSIARHGLKPLQQITRAAQGVTATQLNARIGPQGWPGELATLAAEFDKMLARLEASFSRLAQFSADLAHELRTPINNLMGEAEVALTRSRSPDEYRHVLESSLEEFGRLSRMIDSLLFLARAENAETKIQKLPLSVETEVRAVFDFYDALAEERGVALQTRGSAMVEADVILFRRALSNLLVNALHYTPRGGTVSVEVRQPVADPSVEISVRDTGCGIAPEHLPKIFDRFYRVDPARTGRPRGTGLGLALVKSIMDLHGGRVSVQSEPGQGTTFTLRFPKPEDEDQI